MLRIVEGRSAGINQAWSDNALAEANAVPACNSLLVLYRLRAPRQKSECRATLPCFTPRHWLLLRRAVQIGVPVTTGPPRRRTSVAGST